MSWATQISLSQGCVSVCVLIAPSPPTLCHPMDCSLPGSSVHGILQARILEWVAIPFSGDLPNLGIEPRSPALQADSFLSEPPGKPPSQLRGPHQSAEGLSRTNWLILPWVKSILSCLTAFEPRKPLHGASLIAQLVKNPALLSNAGEPSSISGSARAAGEGIGYPFQYPWASLVAQLVKNPPAMWETWVWPLG